MICAAMMVAPAAGQICYECTAKTCYDEFSTKTSMVDQQLERELAGIDRELSAMALAAAQKAEVQEATEGVLRDNAALSKKLAYDGLRECLTSN